MHLLLTKIEKCIGVIQWYQHHGYHYPMGVNGPILRVFGIGYHYLSGHQSLYFNFDLFNKIALIKKYYQLR